MHINNINAQLDEYKDRRQEEQRKRDGASSQFKGGVLFLFIGALLFLFTGGWVSLLGGFLFLVGLLTAVTNFIKRRNADKELKYLNERISELRGKI